MADADGSGELLSLDATALRGRLAARQVSATELAQALLARIAARDADVRAWVWLDHDAVLAAARALDSGPLRGPLHGLPIGIKDVFETADMPTGFGSPLYEGYRPAGDAASVATLRAAGALIFGKTATVEFAAMGHKPPTMNPLDRARSPGGTSSGSAAAVADRQVPLALGTQTAGSTIRPASFCGAYAFKPTWNLVSREGVKFFSVSIDTVTWFARSCDDLQLLFDQFDIIGLPDAPLRPIAGMRIGLYRTAHWDRASDAVKQAYEDAARMLEAQGARCEAVETPAYFTDLNQAHTLLVMAEGRMSLLNDWRARGAAMHPDFARHFFSGTPVSADRLRAAIDLAADARRVFDAIASGFDLVLTPSAADVAPLRADGTGDPVFNQLWSLLQVPCVNLPLPVVGLPIGITATAPRYADRPLLSGAAAVDRALRR